MSITTRMMALLVLAAACCGAGIASAQNPVQWSGSVDQSVARAREQSLPLLFWVTGDHDQDGDDLDDAQEECFRDPAVVDIVHARFVPVRVSRNSNVIEAAERLGLPTEYGLYCAVLTTDGRLLDSIGPAEVADPAQFAARLREVSERYLDELYERELRPVLEDPSAPKQEVRRAAQAAWRLGIRRADGAIIGLLRRTDLTPSERSALYAALATLASEASIEALLERAADDKTAATALLKAGPGALQWLIQEMPGTEQGTPTARQMAAYLATVRICRLASAKPQAWWEGASPDSRRAELERVLGRAAELIEYWEREDSPDE